MPNTPQRWICWIVDHRALTLLLLVTFTAFAAMGYVDPGWPQRAWQAWHRGGAQPADASLQGSPAPGGTAGASSTSGAPSDSRRPLPAVREMSLSRADVVLVATSEHFFSPEGAAAMREAVADLERLPTVQEVLWLDRAPPLNIFGLREPIFPRTDASPERFQAAKAKAQEHPLIVGQLMSSDARTLLLLVRLNWFNVRSDADCSDEIKATAIRAVARHPQAGVQIQMTGDVPLYLMIIGTQKANQLKYQLIGYSMILFLAVVLFRGLSAVIIVALAPAVGVFWTIGCLRYLHMEDNPFNDVVLPIMLSLVGFTDGVHMIVQIREQRARGLSPNAATKKGVSDVGLACFLTSLTTAIGFGSLGLAHHAIVREFGWCCVLGVILEFMAVILIIPLAASSPLGKRLHVGHGEGLISKNLATIGVAIDFVIRHARVVSALGIAATIVLAGVALTLRPDDRLTNALPAGSEPQRAMAHLDTALGGLQVGEVQIRWDSSQAEDSPVVFEVIDQVDQLLASQSLIGSPLTVTRLLKALPGDGPLLERLSMVELLPPPLKRAYYKPDERMAKATFRVQDRGIAAYGPVFEQIESGLVKLEAEHPGFALQLEGRPVSRWRNLYQIVVDLASSLGSAALIIFVVLGLAYRSLRLGLIAVVPNVFPLAVTASMLVALGLPLEVVSVCSFTICLGIAVDDTIHFLTRYTEEQRVEKDEIQAIRKAFIGVGTGMIMTTIVLVAGFSTVLWSEVRDHRVFCAMGSLTLVAALVGDLFILPAMLVTFRKRP
jgi:predicted RND superfamily exporter protein